MPLSRPEDASSFSSSWGNASRHVAQCMIRSHIRSVLRAIAEQNEDWIEPLVDTWSRHIAKRSEQTESVVVAWLRSEYDVWKRTEEEPQEKEDTNGVRNPEEEGDITTVDLDPPSTTSPFPKRPITAWAKLRRLGEPHDHLLDPIVNDESYEETLQRAIAQLDHLGRTNQTYWWPDQWPVIERAVQQMRERLHPPPKETTSSSIPSSSHHQTWDAQLSQALLSEQSSSAVEAQHPPSLDQDETMQQLVDRKRKSVNKKRRWNAELQQFVPKQKRSHTPVVDRDTAVEPYDNDGGGDVPRPASQDEGISQLDWKRAMEQEEKEEASKVSRGYNVDEYLHASTTPEEIPARLLGALCDLGHAHGFHQARVDAALMVRPRDAVRARLGNHRPEEIKKPSRPWSKLLRTLSDAPQQHWFDLDVGHCILESAMDGSMYAFRSVEMCLRDEDT